MTVHCIIHIIAQYENCYHTLNVMHEIKCFNFFVIQNNVAIIILVIILISKDF